MLPADWLEDQVWQDCREFVHNPGKALADAQRALEARLQRAGNAESQRDQIARSIDGKTLERERVTTLARRGVISVDEAEQQLHALQDEADTLRTQLAALDAERDLGAGLRGQVQDAAALLALLRERVADVDRTGDVATKRAVIEQLVSEIRVETTGQGRRKVANVSLVYAFSDPRTRSSYNYVLT